MIGLTACCMHRYRCFCNYSSICRNSKCQRYYVHSYVNSTAEKIANDPLCLNRLGAGERKLSALLTECAVIPNVNRGRQHMVAWSLAFAGEIQCGIVIAWSISSYFLTTDTVFRSREGDILGIFCKFQPLICVCVITFSAVCHIVW